MTTLLGGHDLFWEGFHVLSTFLTIDTISFGGENKNFLPKGR